MEEKERRSSKNYLWIILLIVILILIAIFYIFTKKESQPSLQISPTNQDINQTPTSSGKADEGVIFELEEITTSEPENLDVKTLEDELNNFSTTP